MGHKDVKREELIETLKMALLSVCRFAPIISLTAIIRLQI